MPSPFIKIYERGRHTPPPSLRPLSPVCGLASAQKIGEEAVGRSVQRIGRFARGAQQLEAFAEGFGHMVGLQGARLIEGGRAAQTRGEIIEIDEEIVPALLAG